MLWYIKVNSLLFTIRKSGNDLVSDISSSCTGGLFAVVSDFIITN